MTFAAAAPAPPGGSRNDRLSITGMLSSQSTALPLSARIASVTLDLLANLKLEVDAARRAPPLGICWQQRRMAAADAAGRHVWSAGEGCLPHGSCVPFDSRGCPSSEHLRQLGSIWKRGSSASGD